MAHPREVAIPPPSSLRPPLTVVPGNGSPGGRDRTCAGLSALAPDALLSADRADLPSAALKALQTDIVSHGARPGAGMPDQDGVGYFRGAATVDLCEGKQMEDGMRL